MIKFRLEIQNPWTKDRFKHLGYVSGRFFKNKAWELEHTFYDGLILDCCFEFTTRGDHAGLEISLGILGYAIGFHCYDIRHWNYENKTWMNYD